jgi:glycosyltransferase involved in cell wall biosynthesis
MKVLVISHMYPSIFNEVTGIFVHEQVKVLVAKGIEVQVVSPVPWVPFPINYLSYKWKNYSNIPKRTVYEEINVWHPRYLSFPRSWFFASSGQRMYLGIRELVTKIYRDFQFDLIHAHTLMPDGFAGILVRKKIGIPLIVTIHGSDLLIYPYRNKLIFSHSLKVLKKASRFITVSYQLKNKCYNEFNVSEKKIKVIPNGYDHKTFNFKPKKKVNDQLVILFVGNIIKAKGIFDLLDAIKIIRKLDQNIYQKISWVIVGKGADMEEFKKRLNTFNIINDIKVVGQVPHEKISKYMKNADFVILPSWSEGLPATLVEAMGCGLPIIATKVGGIPEIINKDIGILVDPKNPEELAKGIINAISKDWNRKLISEYTKRYTWEKNAEKTIKMYKEALNSEK